MEAAFKIFAVEVGGAFGATARYLINISPLAGIFDKFPLPTFLINIIGSFLIGFLMIVFADKFVVNDNLRMAVIVLARLDRMEDAIDLDHHLGDRSGRPIGSEHA